jgi:hypothetical protein
LEKELDALAGEVDTPPVALAPKQQVAILVQNHTALVAEYQKMRIAGKTSTIVGDNERAKQEFGFARQILKRLQALKQIAQEEGLADFYEQFLGEWAEAQRAQTAVDTTAADDLKRARERRREAKS